MSGTQIVALAPLVLLALVVLAVFAGRRLKDAASVVERAHSEAFLDDAPTVHIGCCYCGAPDGEEHDPWCSRRTPAVVAGSDLDPLERLWRLPAYGERRRAS